MAQQQNVEDVQPNIFADDFDSGFDSDSGGNFESGGEGGQPEPGQGQSKSSRRRRRKRKNKLAGDAPTTAMAGSEGGAAPVSAPVQQTIVMEGESLSLAGSAAPAFTPRRPQSNSGGQQGGGQQNGQQQGAGQSQGKRWKKKFRERERGGRSDGGGSGSSQGGGGGFRAEGGGGGGFQRDRHGRPDNFGNLVDGARRKSKSGGGGKERGFVGPMDHSYRSESADFNGGPASTINLNGRRPQRHHGDSQPIDHNAPRAIPVPENAQTHIYFFIEELFLNAKISEAARKQGIKVAFVKNDKDALAELTSGEEQNHPSLIVFDLNNANAKPLTTIPKLKTKLKRGTSIIGFLSHLQGDLKAKAMEAGCDVVMPRAAFSQNLPNLLRRYGSEDEDEVNYNY